jgi:hypothetical protein
VSLPGLTDPNPGFSAHKPKADIYTWLLLVALVAIIMACTFFAMELNRYNWDLKAAGARAPAASLERAVTAAARIV